MIKKILESFKNKRTFDKAIENEQPKKLAVRQAHVVVEIGQTWRSAMDHADQFCEPVILTVKNVGQECLSYVSNYNNELKEIKIDEFKSSFVIINEGVK